MGSELPLAGEVSAIVAGAPGEGADNRHVTEAVSRAINTMLADQRLLECLAK